MECEGTYNSPNTAEIKSEWSFPSVTPRCLLGIDRDILTFFNFDDRSKDFEYSIRQKEAIVGYKERAEFLPTINVNKESSYRCLPL
jgi:hypothetical protein